MLATGERLPLLADVTEEVIWRVQQQREQLAHLLGHHGVVGGHRCGAEVLVEHLAVVSPLVGVVHGDEKPVEADARIV